MQFGLAIMVLVFDFGPVSGGHINPAVSWALLITRNLDMITFCAYVVAQMLGAFFGALCARSASVLENIRSTSHVASRIFGPRAAQRWRSRSLLGSVPFWMPRTVCSVKAPSVQNSAQSPLLLTASALCGLSACCRFELFVAALR